MEVLSLLICIILSASFASADEGAHVAMSCFEEMNKENNVTHLLLDINTPQQIDYFCKRMHDNMKCIADNEHYLTTSQNTEYLRLTSGVYQFFLNICSPGTHITAEYIEHALCFDLVRHQIVSCGSELPPMDSPYMKDTTGCCIIEEYQKCISTSVEIRCGVEAANVTKEMLTRYHKTFMNECQDVSSRDCETTNKNDGNTRIYGGKTTTDSNWVNQDGGHEKHGTDNSDDYDNWDSQNEGSSARQTFMPAIEALLFVFISLHLFRHY